MTIKPPFGRQGNKTPILQKIIKEIPQHKTFVELFAGSAVLYFNIKNAERSVINDLDKDVYNRLKLLEKAPLDINLYKQDLDTLPRIKHFFTHHSNSIPDRILYEKIKSNLGFLVFL